MDELSALHLGHTPISYDSVTGTGRARLPFAQVPLDRATAYAAEDADVTLRLWHALRPRLRANQTLALYEQIERRLVPRAAGDGAHRHQGGCRRPARHVGRFRRAHGRHGDRNPQMAGEPFNLGSPKQLGEMLFDEHELPGGKRMKTGAWGTDAAVLQGLADQGHELPARILDWRQLAEAEIHLCRRPGRADQPRDRPGAHQLRHGDRHHRAAVLHRPQPAKYSRSAPRKAAASDAPSSPNPATCWSAPTTRRSSCACSPTSPTSPR